MSKFKSLMPILTLMLVILVSFTASCDKRNPPPIIPAVPAPPPISELREITRIWSNPEFIYQDNNITYANVFVEVKDGEGFGVFNQIVQFRTNLGRVLANVPTDSTGVAQTTFWDDGQVGMAKIVAEVRRYHASVVDSIVASDRDSIMIEIKPKPGIASVQLNLPGEEEDDPYEMTVMQTIPVTAKPIDTDGNSVPNNTLVTFTCEKGRFIDSAGNEIGRSTIASTFNGVASVKYSSWITATTTTSMTNEIIKAAIAGEEKTREITIRPARPSTIDLRSYVQVGTQLIQADTSFVGSQNHIYMRAGLTDVYGNSCPAQPVRFTTDIGSFINTTQSVTINSAADGWAQVRFTPGLSSGAAQIRAFANGDTLTSITIFNITSDEIHSISFTQSDQINLNVANTGGLQSAILRVKLRDINGNLINSADSVYFRIENTNAPAGANLNNQPQADSVLVISNGGEAQISVNSGTASGMLKIRVWVRKGTKYVWSIKTNIVIHAGPPAPAPNGIVPFLPAFNTGTNIGGGLWRIIAGAMVKDIHNNPVDKGTAVWFELLNAPDCTIVAEAFVGNVSANGDSAAGVAFTTFTYRGTMTNQSITIQANCGDDEFGNPNYGIATIVLPLNDPRFEVHGQPQAVYFDEAPLTAIKSVDIYCYLTDGQGLPVEDSKIMLTTNRGIFVQNVNGIYDPLLPPNEWWSIITDAEGTARGRISFKAVECPPPDPLTGNPGSTTANVTGRIALQTQGTSTIIDLFRYPGTAPW